MGIEIRQHLPGRDVADFIRAGHEVFRGDPAWVPPLDLDLRERLTPQKNPFFHRAEVVLFTAWSGGRLVGRCSAQIDREHLRIHQDESGFFGFFDTVQDEEVARALLDASRQWLRERRMKHILGPFSLYVNEEVGVLVEGFDSPPSLMMAHSRPYQGALAESAGLEKVKDLLAWRYEAGVFPARAIKAWEEIKSMPEVRLRSVDTRNMARELQLVMDIYNDAWEGKWAMVPALPDEVEKVAKDLKLLIDDQLAFIAEVDGNAVGMCIMLPNLNEVIQDLGGKLLPFGIVKLLWRLKVKRPRSTRLMMLGIRKELRGVKKYGGLSAAMYVEVAKRGIARGYQWGELSWTREDDGPINVGIKAMGARLYKKYRVYGAPLT
jgi:hypothetical protein